MTELTQDTGNGAVAGDARLRDYVRRLAVELQQARGQLRESVERDHEPVAIVGMACRYPGGVGSPDQLWELVASGTDAIGPFPTDRGWELESLYPHDPDNPDAARPAEGGFLPDAARFDPGFFAMSPREAVATDPQQRQFLEVSWEALERAGIVPETLRGTATGVFAGLMYHDYPGSYGAGSLVSGRVAYQLGLVGPAVTVDTACSSSLVALHLATRALRAGECTLALVGGVTVMGTPNTFTEFARQGGLSPDGRCKPFAAAADGTGWSEGVGVLVVERLSQARRHGHRVWAVVRGSAVNSDGPSNGLTAPHGPSQRRVIRAALVDAGLSAGQVDAVEAHGTGTPLGDPIEAQALLATYGQDRSEEHPLWLGSIKSNLGHSQAAAGVAGIIKMTMALHHDKLPRTLHVDRPTPHVDWSSGAVRLLTEPVQWARGAAPRRAAVSSFGVSGTNAHVIIEEAPGEPAAPEPASAEPADGDPAPAVAWPLSARTPAALRAQASQLRAFAAARPELSPAAVGRALVVTRSAFEHRAIVLGADRETLLAGLAALADGTPAAQVIEDVARGGDVAFVFPGQGSQWAAMAQRLLAEAPVFRDAIADCERELSRHVDWSLTAVLRGDAGAPGLDRVDVVQPVLFALMVSLAALWRSYGITPAAVVGHSQGEIAAACVAGALSLADAAAVVALRSQLLRELSGLGGMVSVALDESAVRDRIARWPGRISVAAVNGPASVVLSGDVDALAELVTGCERDGVWARRVEVDYASHSAQVQPLRERLVDLLSGIEPRPAQVPFYSTVDAAWLDTTALDAGYWYRNLRQTVRFDAAVQALLDRGCSALVEVSPHPVLASAMGDTVAARGGPAAVLGTLRRDEGGLDRFRTSLCQLAVAGAPAAWSALAGPAPAGSPDGRPIELPTYPFERHRYWQAVQAGAGEPVVSGHPLLGAAVTLAGSGGLVLTGRLSSRAVPWLADHVVHGSVLLPGTVFVELAWQAGAQVGCQAVEELVIEGPLRLPAEGAVLVQVAVAAPEADGRRPLSVYAAPDGGTDEPSWVRHATGVLGAGAPAPATAAGPWPPAGAEPVDPDEVYRRLAAAGLDHGPAFRGLEAVWRYGDELLAEVALPEAAGAQAQRYGVHPALLDAALHPIALGDLLPAAATGAWLPFAWECVDLHATGATGLRVRLSGGGSPGVLRLALADHTGAPVATVRSLAVRPLPAGVMPAAVNAGRDEGLFRIDWTPVPAALDPGRGPVRVGVLDPYPDALAAALCAGGVQVDPVPAADATGTVPEWVLASCPPGDPTAAGVRAALTDTLALAQRWLAEPRFAGSRLVLVTRGAAGPGAVRPGDRPADGPPHDVAGAAAWGLLRSTQSEHPDRFVLIDVDGPASLAALPAALAIGEPQLALRGGRPYQPRLAPVTAEPPAGPTAHDPGIDGWDRDGTVLITGGTGQLGALIARHLAARHGVRHLLLASRHGPAAAGADALVADLAASGAQATIVGCDVSDRAALAALLAAVPDGHPLTAVVHTAGVLADGLLESLDAERLDAVLRPKLDAALHLDELTRDTPLAGFVLFSSAAGVFGGLGQANYAAANAALDALAERRRAAGLPGRALAWGLWAPGGGMTGGLAGSDLDRLARSGFTALSEVDGLALFDAALRLDPPVLVAVRLNRTVLRAQAESGLPPLLRGLVRAPLPRAAGAASGTGLADRLARRPAAERERALVDLVRAHAAVVLGFAGADAIDERRAFKDLGFGSLSAVELRNRLAGATSLRLPATLAFDYPSAAVLGRHLCERLFDPTGAGSGTHATGAVDVRRTGAPAGDDDPVVIVGMGCRYPGGVRSPEDLWRLVRDGGDAIGPFPDDRGWDVDRLYHPDPERPGTSYTRSGGFLADAADFDAAFFGISPREALAMDPQQRLLLEVGWEALERARIDPASLRDSQTGVFVGVMYADYALQLGDGQGAEGFLGTGLGSGVVSGRLAYTLGLHGPAVTVDTACSSSLVALHLAAQALRNGECDLALAGGATVLATPAVFVEFSRQRGLAADGRCKAFAASADGTGMAEGAGLLVLERLSDARRRDHPVLAVVRGSAVNSDGASNGFTAPNGPAQQRVIRQALAAGQLTPDDVDVIEAHGTGTTLGDPIEAQALIATYGAAHPAGQPALLGSVKSNLGHTQAAAGVAGVIKMVAALGHRLVPPTLHVAAPSPHVDWSSGEVRLVTQATPWPDRSRPRRAAVSSFGISGTNAHVILEQPPAARDAFPVGERGALPVLPWILSAKSPAALRGQARRLLDHLQPAGDPPAAVHPTDALPTDVAFSLAATRTAFRHRAAVFACDTDGLRRGLSLLAGDATPAAPPDPAALVVTGRADAPRLALQLSGVDAYLPGLGSDWYGAFPAFAAAFDEACALLDPALATAARRLTVRPAADGAVGDRREADPAVEDRREADGAVGDRRGADGAVGAMFAVQVALCRLLESWGVRPDSVAGTGIGELAAAYLTGVVPPAEVGRAVGAATHGRQPAGAGAQPADVTITVGRVCGAGDGAALVLGTHADVGSEVASLIRAVVTAYVHGVGCEPAALFAGHPVRRVPLPTYPFQRRRYWPTRSAAPARTAPARTAPATSAAERRLWAAVDGSDLTDLLGVLDLRGDEPASAVLAALSGWRQRHGLADPPRRLHGVQWAPVDVPAAPTLSGTWLIVAAPGGEGYELVDPVAGALARYGAVPVPLLVDPAGADREGLYRAVSAVLTGRPPLAGALSLLAIGAGPGPVPAGVAAAVPLLSALVDIAPQASLWCAGPGAPTAIGGAPAADGARAVLAGLGRALSGAPGWGGVVELPERLDATARARLCAMLAGAAAGRELALTGDGLLGRRLVPLDAPPSGPPGGWRPAGTVLVAGGPDEVVAGIARWAAGAGAARVLVAGGGPELRDEPGVEPLDCHPTDAPALARLVASVAADQPLRTVVCAGRIAAPSAPLPGEWAELVTTAQALDTATDTTTTPLLVLVSTCPDGAAAPAGAVYEALAQARRARGGRALALTVPSGTADEVVRGLRLAVDSGQPAVVLTSAHADPPTTLDGPTPDRPGPDLPAGSADAAAAAPADAAAAANPGTDAELTELVRLICAEVADVLGHDSAEHVDPDGDLLELGLTSVAAIEMHQRLKVRTSVELPVDVFYEYATPVALGRRLAEEIAARHPVPQAPGPSEGRT